MSQVDSFAANGGLSGLATRQAFNAILDALATCSSGSTAPSNPFPGMFWRDTATSPSVLKIRDDANTSWVDALSAFGGTTPGIALFKATTKAGQRTALELKNGAQTAVTDNDDMAVDPENLPKRKNVEAAIAAAPNPVKAWVNFNGTGTVAIRDALNVSSITDNGSGDYTVNLSSAQADTNYAVLFGGSRAGNGSDSAAPFVFESYQSARTTTAIRVRTGGMNAGAFAFGDNEIVELAIVH